MKRSFAALVGAALLALSSCGSSDGGGGNSNARLSCVISSTDSMNCVDYSGGAVTAGARNSCTQAGGTLTEGALCSMTGVSGICPFSEEGGTSRTLYYDLETGEIPALETGCTDAHGTWSTS